MSIKFIDLFSGCGGLTEAFLNNKKFSPIKIKSSNLQSDFTYELKIPSAQIKSCLLLAALSSKAVAAIWT